MKIYIKGIFLNKKYSKIMKNSQNFHLYLPYFDSQRTNLSIKNFTKMLPKVPFPKHPENSK
jgi:hypothetical protein